MAYFKKYPFEFEGCMFFTFFNEFRHVETLEKVAQEYKIHISYPLKTNNYGMCNDEIQYIYRNNLKLFYDPKSPPSDKVIDALNLQGFRLQHKLYDRYIFHFQE